MAADRLDAQHGPARRPALDGILASLHFYRANAQLWLTEPEEAIDSFRRAVALSLNEGNTDWPRYIEPLNNLGWLLKTQGRYDEAISELNRIRFGCTERVVHEACSTAWFNLADAHQEAGRHADAVEGFEEAARRVTASQHAPPRLLAAIHQGLALSLVALAQERALEAREPLLARASDAWQQAEAARREAGIEDESFRMTRGRILIARRDWPAAIALLTSLDVSGEDRVIREGLLAGIHSCLGDAKRSQDHMEHAMTMQFEGRDARLFHVMRDFQRIVDGCAPEARGGEDIHAS